MCTFAGTSDPLGSIAEQEKPGFSTLSKLQSRAKGDYTTLAGNVNMEEQAGGLG